MWIEFHPGRAVYYPDEYKILRLKEFIDRHPENAGYTYTMEGRESPLGEVDLLTDGLHAWKHVVQEEE